MHRLFVAISLPEIANDALEQLQSDIYGARWRPPENFHLTLQFIGDVDRHGFDEIAQALDAITAPSFDLTLQSCGFFGDRAPRAVWAGVGSSEPLVHVQKKIAANIQRAGVRLEKRKFTPHVTLAYLKGANQDTAAGFCASHNLFSFGPFPVCAFHLFESFLGGDAAHYEIVQSYALSSSR